MAELPKGPPTPEDIEWAKSRVRKMSGRYGKTTATEPVEAKVVAVYDDAGRKYLVKDDGTIDSLTRAGVTITHVDMSIAGGEPVKLPLRTEPAVPSLASVKVPPSTVTARTTKARTTVYLRQCDTCNLVFKSSIHEWCPAADGLELHAGPALHSTVRDVDQFRFNQIERMLDQISHVVSPKHAGEVPF